MNDGYSTILILFVPTHRGHTHDPGVWIYYCNTFRLGKQSKKFRLWQINSTMYLENCEKPGISQIVMEVRKG